MIIQSKSYLIKTRDTAARDVYDKVMQGGEDHPHPGLKKWREAFFIPVYFNLLELLSNSVKTIFIVDCVS